MSLEEHDAAMAQEELSSDEGGQAEESPKQEGNEVPDLKEKIAELEDAKLRMAAENQNTRKRLVKQQQDAFKYRHQDILRDLAEVIDNFERAIESAAESRDFETFHKGILMIEKHFSGMLTEKYGLERIDGEGGAFDPAAHEAVMAEESPAAEAETVKQVFQAGYRLHDRVLRPAKVVVLKPETVPADEGAAAEEDKDRDEGVE